MASRGLVSLLNAALLWGAMTGCSGTGNTPEKNPANGIVPEVITKVVTGTTGSGLEPFESAEAFDAWARELRAAQKLASSSTGTTAQTDGAGAPAEATASEKSEPSITNNQESGVDEGDIVKAAGDYFVMLRRGRLFTVRHTADGAPALEAVHRVDVQPAGYTKGTWYDELLVHGQRVVVIGYSYQVRATEIVLFDLAADGKLSHAATFFLRSNDYYSSRNYASRLVDGKLITYMPYYLFSGGGDPATGVTLPAFRKWVKGDQLTEWQDILAKTHVYRPVQGALHPTLHTVVQCDLTAPELDCSARSVLAPSSRTFYVSKDFVYLWVSPGYFPYDGVDSAGNAQDSFLYRFPLTGGAPAAVRTRGMPVDQFSFKEAEKLNVVVRANGGGDAMWAPEVSQGDLALLQLPHDAFSGTPSPAPGSAYVSLPKVEGYALQNRFVGSHLVYGSGSGWYPASTEKRVFVVPLSSPSTTTELALTHGVERLEPLGSESAAVVGRTDNGLGVSVLSLGTTSWVADVFTEPGVSQGETRSHGFFFRPDGTGPGGTLGLPVRLSGPGHAHLSYGSAEVMYLRLGADLKLTSAGALAASIPETAIDDACKVSCVDWYGNARPIFFRGRTFALLGYELVEGAAPVSGGPIQESRRLDYLLP